MVTLQTWRERMSEDMRLRDFRPRTQEGYLLAVRQFMDRTAREPEAITDGDVRAYFLYLREDKKLAPSTINAAGGGGVRAIARDVVTKRFVEHAALAEAVNPVAVAAAVWQVAAIVTGEEVPGRHQRALGERGARHLGDSELSRRIPPSEAANECASFARDGRRGSRPTSLAA